MTEINPTIELLVRCRQLELTDQEALQMLRDGNVISDHCTQLKDIAFADIPKCMAYLEGQCDVGS